MLENKNFKLKNNLDLDFYNQAKEMMLEMKDKIIHYSNLELSEMITLQEKMDEWYVECVKNKKLDKDKFNKIFKNVKFRDKELEEY